MSRPVTITLDLDDLLTIARACEYAAEERFVDANNCDDDYRFELAHEAESFSMVCDRIGAIIEKVAP